MAGEKCETCGKPATCFGWYESGTHHYACDDCCGHGNEDGHCAPLDEVEGEGCCDAEIRDLRAESARLRARLAEVGAAQLSAEREVQEALASSREATARAERLQGVLDLALTDFRLKGNCVAFNPDDVEEVAQREAYRAAARTLEILSSSRGDTGGVRGGGERGEAHGTFPGDLDRMPSGHTRHCEARMKWGDGECECSFSKRAPGSEAKGER